MMRSTVRFINLPTVKSSINPSIKATIRTVGSSSKLPRNELMNGMKFYSQTSTDREEVNKFDKCSTTSDHNWYTSELMRPLRNLNKLRVPLIRNQLISTRQFNKMKINESQPLENCNLLDVGCGGGLLSECLARLGANVTAIDANENNIRFARDHLTSIDATGQLASRLNYVHSDLDSFSRENQKFDAIVASEVLEHVDSVDEFIRNCANLLNDDGLLIITTINQTPQSYLCAILLAENVLKLAPKNAHQYNKLVLLNGLSLILEESKFHFYRPDRSHLFY